jgi:hypothetical protein
VDTCHSGELNPDGLRVAKGEKLPEGEVKVHVVRGLDLDEQPRLGLSNSFRLLQDRFADLRRGSGAVVISSAGGVEYALESDKWKNGVFTHALLRGLGGEIDPLRPVPVSALRDFVQREVQRLTHGRQAPTTRRENLELDFTID